MKPIRLMSGFLTVGGWTLMSRVLGFARDAMILALLGTGPLYEAYVVAFRLPNMFRRFFAEGAFNTAFVPMFSKRVEAGEDARAFAEDALAGLEITDALAARLSAEQTSALDDVGGLSALERADLVRVARVGRLDEHVFGAHAREDRPDRRRVLREGLRLRHRHRHPPRLPIRTAKMS